MTARIERADIVVVGAGAAGCVVAARVADRIRGNVILLEAGPSRPSELSAELRGGWVMSREFDWGYRAEPTGDEGDGEKLRRVKLVGGTSSIVRFALRGSPADYDGWRALGNPGWGWDDVLPAFRAVETDLQFGHQPWHGDRGPIPVGRYPELARTEVHEAAVTAAAALGVAMVADHNQPGAVGVGPMPMSSRDGIRVTSYDAYLGPGRRPPNVAIRPDAEVASVILAPGRRATGVRLLDGTRIEAGTVVLAAGTYGSPAILLRSGIGPAAQLAAFDIPVVVDLPGVGENLADHPGFDVDAGYRGPVDPTRRLNTVASVRSSLVDAGAPPDVLLWITDPVQPDGSPPIFEVDPIVMTPESRGTVRLRSADPDVAPRISLPGLRTDRDTDRLAEGYRLAWDIANRPEVRGLCGEPASPDLSGLDRSALRAAIRAGANSYPHVVGTCAMGPDPADGAVVDAGGRVHGVDGLFVVDASIMPTQISGFSHLPTLMLAKRLSAWVAPATART